MAELFQSNAEELKKGNYISRQTLNKAKKLKREDIPKFLSEVTGKQFPVHVNYSIDPKKGVVAYVSNNYDGQVTCSSWSGRVDQFINAINSRTNNRDEIKKRYLELKNKEIMKDEDINIDYREQASKLDLKFRNIDPSKAKKILDILNENLE